jgi:hypothetical protein
MARVREKKKHDELQQNRTRGRRTVRVVGGLFAGQERHHGCGRDDR